MSDSIEEIRTRAKAEQQRKTEQEVRWQRERELHAELEVALGKACYFYVGRTHTDEGIIEVSSEDFYPQWIERLLEAGQVLKTQGMDKRLDELEDKEQPFS